MYSTPSGIFVSREEHALSSQLQAFDRAAWRAEVLGQEELFFDLHPTMPKKLIFERELLICRMS